MNGLIDDIIDRSFACEISWTGIRRCKSNKSAHAEKSDEDSPDLLSEGSEKIDDGATGETDNGNVDAAASEGKTDGPSATEADADVDADATGMANTGKPGC